MKKHHAIGLGGLVVLIILIVGLILIFNKPAKAPATTTATTNQGNSSMQLQKTDETVGTGAEAVDGKTVTVNYTGTLADGTVFDSTSKDGGQPFSFTLGAGQVIKGWDQGLTKYTLRSAVFSLLCAIELTDMLPPSIPFPLSFASSQACVSVRNVAS